ncbi:hypothetical protein [Neorhodopirellula lusitana]|uniref:hypothetical protein n=1 Tax=Neorhodopirellula lusitana TaxID=445327 RepID=UPI0024B86E84|nr:hypothetical protein [Neorhodopirellula lusitana]
MLAIRQGARIEPAVLTTGTVPTWHECGLTTNDGKPGGHIGSPNPQVEAPATQFSLLGWNPTWLASYLAGILLGWHPTWLASYLAGILLGWHPTWLASYLAGILLGWHPTWLASCFPGILPAASPTRPKVHVIFSIMK